MGKRDCQEFLIEVVEGGRKGCLAGLFRGGLTVLSGIYYLLIEIRQLLYYCRLLRGKRISGYTISLGNITVGGTGKTPAVEMLAGELQKRGRRVAVLSRGYRRVPGPRQNMGGQAQSSPGYRRAGTVPSKMMAGRRDKIGIVSDGKKILMGAREAGDEPYLLARNLPAVVVVVGKDRIASGNYALTNFGVDTFILDDGYQYWPLKRDLDIVVIDSLNPFGNGHLLPRGRLREPLRNLGRGNLFLLTRVDQADDLESLIERLRKINPRADIVESIHRPDHLIELETEERRELTVLSGKKVLALSSIGHPEAFERTLTGLGALLVEKVRFPDHHGYKDTELREIEEEALRKEAEFIVTTEKDAVRIAQEVKPPAKLLYLVIKLSIVRGEESLKKLLR